MPRVMDSPPSKPLCTAPYKQQVHWLFIESGFGFGPKSFWWIWTQDRVLTLMTKVRNILLIKEKFQIHNTDRMGKIFCTWQNFMLLFNSASEISVTRQRWPGFCWDCIAVIQGWKWGPVPRWLRPAGREIAGWRFSLWWPSSWKTLKNKYMVHDAGITLWARPGY